MPVLCQQAPICPRYGVMGWGAIAPVYRDTEYHAVTQEIVPLVSEEGVLKGGGQTNDAKHREFLALPLGKILKGLRPFNIMLVFYLLITMF